jgi:hypothetical protein
MAFTVEDGTGVENANAYVEISFVTDYLTERGRQAAWIAAAEAAQQAAIIAATDYAELRYARRLRGYREFPDVPQGLSFPRLGIYDREGYAVEGVPLKWKQGIAEYAERALGDELLPDPATSTVGGAVVEEEKVVGPIKTRTKYQEGTTSQVLIHAYPAADGLFKEFLQGSGRGGAYR